VTTKEPRARPDQEQHEDQGEAPANDLTAHDDMGNEYRSEDDKEQVHGVTPVAE
jgi:hypothetical protein